MDTVEGIPTHICTIKLVVSMFQGQKVGSESALYEELLAVSNLSNPLNRRCDVLLDQFVAL